MAYMDDDDENEKSTDNLAIPPVIAGHGAVQLPEALQDYLSKKLQERNRADSPEFANFLAKQGQQNADQQNLASFAGALTRAGAKAGSVSGHETPQSALTGLPQELAQAQQTAQAPAAMQQQAGEKELGINAQVLEHLAGLQSKKDIANQNIAAHSAAIQEKETPYEYQDQGGKTRVGRFTPGTGLVTSPKDPISGRKDLQGQQANKEDANSDKILGSVQQNMNKDSVMMDAVKKQNETARADELVDAARTNPVARKSIALDLARMIVPSRLNETEIRALGGSGAVGDRLGQAFDDLASGELSDANYGYMKDLVARIKKGADADLHDRTLHYAKQYSVRTGKKLEDAYSDLTGGEAMPKQTAQATPQGAPGGGLIPTATASPATAPSPQDQQALQWANQNANDPRAAKIKETLKAKGIQ